MRTEKNLSKRKFFLISMVAIIIVVIASLESLLLVKDTGFFNNWLIANSLQGQEHFGVYVTSVMSQYILKIIIPVFFGISTYISFAKTRVNGMFIFIWSVLLAGSLGFTLISIEKNSLLFFVYIILYIVLILNVLSLVDRLSDKL